MYTRLSILFAMMSLAAACGSDGTPAPADAGTPDVAPDRPTTVDAPAADEPVVDATTADVPATDVPAADATTVPVLNDCAAADYTDRSAASDDRTVVPRGTTGYTPRCLMIQAGQSVTFSMNFATHPLVPGVPHGSSAGATTPSPITAQSAGSTYAVAFPSAGYFPFYCRTHGHVGMAGVVMVMP